MPFREILKNIVEQVDGGIGAIILGYDGIPIDEYLREKTELFDFELLAVEYTSLMKEVKRTVELLKTGDLEEVAVTSGRTRIIVNAVNSDFFIMLALTSDGNFGKGRYLLKRFVPQIRAGLQ